VIWAGYLAIVDRGNCHIPRCICDHDEAEEGPNSVIAERGDEDCHHTACAENVCPLALVQVIVQQIYVAACVHTQTFERVSPRIMRRRRICNYMDVPAIFLGIFLLLIMHQD
jgi:hypothetical protein